jgi:hypothetical protein
MNDPDRIRGPKVSKDSIELGVSATHNSTSAGIEIARRLSSSPVSEFTIT